MGSGVEIGLSGFYPHGDNEVPVLELNGSSVRIKVGFLPRANVAMLSGDQGMGLAGDMGPVLIGVAIDSMGKIVQWREIPPEVGRTEGSNSLDWLARLEEAMNLFQSE